MEQPLKIETIVKLDFVDCLKCLFGRCIKIKTTVYVPQEQPIDSYNAFSETTIEPTTSYFVKQDRPHFGYRENDLIPKQPD